MGILGKLKKLGHGETGVREFSVQTIRFKKFLENARTLLELAADGREKVAGEYIFDRHYVVSLIDSVVDRLGMMVYDAGVLVPEKSVSLYAAHDRLKQAARHLITGPVESAGDAEDPEYKLLADTLQWFDDPAGPVEKTVMALMKKAFLDVMQDEAGAVQRSSLFDSDNLRAADMDIYLVDLWRDPLSLPVQKRSVAGFNSIPLRHLLMDVRREKATDTGGAAPGKAAWVAAVDEYHLSLNRLGPGPCFRLEALASGYEPSDFIFVYTDRPGLLETLLPRGLHVEAAAQGRIAWSLDMSANAIEKSLAAMGRGLFDERLWVGE